eukprot:scaffold3382_cov58-Phaeocystis_antarctica.AAC.7
MLIYLRRGVHHAPGIRFTLVVASRLRLLLAWVWVGGAPVWLRVGAAATPGGGERARCVSFLPVIYLSIYRVARLCVALVADAEEHDDTYAVALSAPSTMRRGHAASARRCRA